MSTLEPLGEPGKRKEYFEKLGHELEVFLLYLQNTPDALVSYVNDPVRFLNDEELLEKLNESLPGGEEELKEFSDVAKGLLLQSDYSVVQEVMGYRKSTAVRWVVSWVV